MQFGSTSAKVEARRSSVLPAPGGVRLEVHKVIATTRFDIAIGFVILLNSAMIGLESTYGLEGWETPIFHRLEHVFLLVYSLELAARFYCYGLSCLKNGWVAFDFVLVTIGLIAAYILSPLLAYLDGEDDGGALGMLMVLRTLRLFRLARAVRLLAQFKVLWMLVRGLLSSAGTMAYVFVLMFLILYVFACVAVEIITKPHFALAEAERAENLEYDILVMNYWSTIPVSMLTLMMFSTFDSVGAMYLPMVRHRPLLIGYFVSFILLVSICLMNLVTAVIVESSLEQASQDKEVAKLQKAQLIEKMIPRFRNIFLTLDKAGDGDLTLEDFGECDEATQQELCELFDTDDLVELFEILDADGGGSVSVDEFCDQMIKLATTTLPMEQVRMMKQISLIRHNIGEHNGCLGEIMQLLNGLWEKSSRQDKLEPRISAVERELGAISSSLREMNASLRILSNG